MLVFVVVYSDEVFAGYAMRFFSNCRDRPICGGVVKQAVKKHDMIMGCGEIRI